MNEKMNKALVYFGREDLTDGLYENNIDDNVQVFLTIRRMIELYNLQPKIDKVEKILKYDGIVEDIYYALCMLFGFEYYDDETMIDKELRDILKEDK